MPSERGSCIRYHSVWSGISSYCVLAYAPSSAVSEITVGTRTVPVPPHVNVFANRLTIFDDFMLPYLFADLVMVMLLDISI